MPSFNWNNSQAVGGIGGILLVAVKLSWNLYACFVKVILFIKGKTRELGTRGMAGRKRAGVSQVWSGDRAGEEAGGFVLTVHLSGGGFACVIQPRVCWKTLASRSSAFTGRSFLPPLIVHQKNCQPVHETAQTTASPRPRSVNVASTSGREPGTSLRRLPSVTSSHNRSRKADKRFFSAGLWLCMQWKLSDLLLFISLFFTITLLQFTDIDDRPANKEKKSAEGNDFSSHLSIYLKWSILLSHFCSVYIKSTSKFQLGKLSIHLSCSAFFTLSLFFITEFMCQG